MNENITLETYTMTQEEEVKWLRKCVRDLQERIDKAIEYIKEHSTTIDYKTMKADYNLNMNDLLDILKGENNE